MATKRVLCPFSFLFFVFVFVLGFFSCVICGSAVQCFLNTIPTVVCDVWINSKSGVRAVEGAVCGCVCWQRDRCWHWKYNLRGRFILGLYIKKKTHTHSFPITCSPPRFQSFGKIACPNFLVWNYFLSAHQPPCQRWGKMESWIKRLVCVCVTGWCVNIGDIPLNRAANLA